MSHFYFFTKSSLSNKSIANGAIFIYLADGFPYTIIAMTVFLLPLYYFSYFPNQHSFHRFIIYPPILSPLLSALYTSSPLHQNPLEILIYSTSITYFRRYFHQYICNWDMLSYLYHKLLFIYTIFFTASCDEALLFIIIHFQQPHFVCHKRCMPIYKPFFTASLQLTDHHFIIVKMYFYF